jgi:L-arabinose isomerase
MSSEKPKTGLLLIGSPRFRKLGAGCKNGDYETRKNKFADELTAKIGSFAKPAFNGIVYSRGDAERAISFFHTQKVDCVICVFLSWSEDRAWVSFLRDMYELPLMLWLPAAPPAPYKDTRDEDDFIEFLSRGGLVGALEGSGSIPRLGKNIEIVSDDFDSAKKRMASFARASLARSRMRKARFGLLANYNEIMWSTYMDPYGYFASVGPEINFISYARLGEETAAVSDKAAKKYMDELASLYHVEKDVDKKLFLESARASLALASLREKLELDALVLNDVDHELFRTIGLRPGFYHPSFNGRNATLTPEGDLGAGAIIYAMKQLTGGHISFAEPFYLDKESNTFSAGHAGPHDHTDERHRKLVRISRDTRFAKTSYKYAGAPFAWHRIPPGLKTFAHFSEANGVRKIICFTAESLPGKHSLCSYSHSDFKTETPVTELFEKIVKTGATQHFGVTGGDIREDLAVFARINKFDFHRF